MSVEEKEIPENIVNALQRLSNKLGMSYNDVLDEFMRNLNDDEYFKRMGLDSEIDRFPYALQATLVGFSQANRGEKYIFIPIGMTPMRLSDKGYWHRNLYAILLKEVEGKYKLASDTMKRIYVKERLAEKSSQIKLFSIYEDYLADIGNGVLMAIQRTSFKNPKLSKINSLDIFTKLLKIPKITIAESLQYPSATDEKGYAKQDDMRIIEGMVASSFEVNRDNVLSGGYRIVDQSLVEPVITSDGQSIGTLTVWVSKEFLVYENKSILYFIGTVSIGKGQKNKGIPSMNAISIIPKVAMKKGGD